MMQVFEWIVECLKSTQESLIVQLNKYMFLLEDKKNYMQQKKAQ